MNELNRMKKLAGLLKEDAGTDMVPTDNPEDKVTLDVPLLIRLMEFAKEDAQSDIDLHNAAEQLVMLSQSGRTLSMADYEKIVNGMHNVDSTPQPEMKEAVEFDNDEDTNGDTRELEDCLDQVDNSLQEAIAHAEDVAHLARNEHSQVSGQIRSYLIPWLEKFISDTNQPGSLASLRRMLERGR